MQKVPVPPLLMKIYLIVVFIIFTESFLVLGGFTFEILDENDNTVEEILPLTGVAENEVNLTFYRQIKKNLVN